MRRRPFDCFAWRADQGQPDAQFQLGLMREKGSGAPPNYAEAQDWFALVAASGEPEAEAGLAGLYEQGYGVEKDLKRAAQW
jgi:TPR repeat protein